VSSPRHFPFGHEPAGVAPTAPLAHTEQPSKPRVEHTASPDDALPQAPVLPFREPISPPPAEPLPLAPLPPAPAPRQLRASVRNAVVLVLIVHNVLVLLYLLARWRR
jgi:hypothetical protein